MATGTQKSSKSTQGKYWITILFNFLYGKQSLSCMVLKRIFCRHCVTTETPQCVKICKLKDLQNDAISEYDPWVTCTDEIGPSLATILFTHWPFQTPITFSWEKCSFALETVYLPNTGVIVWTSDKKILALVLLILSHQKICAYEQFFLLFCHHWYEFYRLETFRKRHFASFLSISSGGFLWPLPPWRRLSHMRYQDEW